MSDSDGWGRVCARPSEYLIKLKRGNVVEHGPGLSAFIWPGQSYTILPTAIQRTAFTADQITAERVGVEVTGVAVYRIADPLLAFRVLDFSPESDGAAVLAETLREMFIGAARRLMANMTVDACLTRRKESIAQELFREIMPVVAGQGRPGDETDRGWGVVIDTIEIQDVCIRSETVFEDLQAPYRARIKQDARLAALESNARVALAQLKQADATDAARLATELRTRQREKESAQALAQVKQLQARLEAELERQVVEERRRSEQAAAQARMELQQLEAEAAVALAQRRAEADRVAGEVDAWVGRRLREVENLYSDERIRHDLVAKALPAAAKALGKGLGPVYLNMTSLSGAGEAVQGLAGAAVRLMEIARAAREGGGEPA